MALPILHRNNDRGRDRSAAAPPAPFDAQREIAELRDRLDRAVDSIWQTSGALLEHGILTVRVPEPEHAKRRRIQIRSV